MGELFRLLQLPGIAEILATSFAVAFLAIRLGHALLDLRRDWDDYQAERPARSTPAIRSEVVQIPEEAQHRAAPPRQLPDDQDGKDDVGENGWLVGNKHALYLCRGVAFL